MMQTKKNHERMVCNLRQQVADLQRENVALLQRRFRARLQREKLRIQAEFRRRGFAIVQDVFSEREMLELVTSATRISEAELLDSLRDSTVEDRGVFVDEDPNGKMPHRARKIDQPFRKSENFRRIALDQRLHLLVGAMMDASTVTTDTSTSAATVRKEPLLFFDQAFLKPPRVGTAKPYHQDNFYFKCTPADDVITCWVAIDDATEINGCLRYIEGSHLGGVVPHVSVPGDRNVSNLVPHPHNLNLSREVAAPVRRGGVVLHHGHTLHSSRRNGSDTWRRSYATHWVSADTHWASDSALPKRPIFDSSEWSASRGFYYVLDNRII